MSENHQLLTCLLLQFVFYNFENESLNGVNFRTQLRFETIVYGYSDHFKSRLILVIVSS